MTTLKQTIRRKYYTNTEDFYDWFVGFAEGDGSIYPSKSDDVGFEVWQSSADREVLDYICRTLGFGQVNASSSKPAQSIYSVYDDASLATLKTIFEPRMCVKYAIARYNRLLKMNSQLKLPTLDSAWLAGIIDAEGCFWIKVEEKGAGPIKFIFELSQNDETLLRSVRSLFSFNPAFKHVTRNGANNWKLCFYSKLVRAELVAYLAKYPLQSHKAEVFAEWLEAEQLMKSDDPSRREKVKDVASRLNKWREEWKKRHGLKK